MQQHTGLTQNQFTNHILDWWDTNYEDEYGDYYEFWEDIHNENYEDIDGGQNIDMEGFWEGFSEILDDMWDSIAHHFENILEGAGGFFDDLFEGPLMYGCPWDPIQGPTGDDRNYECRTFYVLVCNDGVGPWWDDIIDQQWCPTCPTWWQDMDARDMLHQTWLDHFDDNIEDYSVFETLVNASGQFDFFSPLLASNIEEALSPLLSIGLSQEQWDYLANNIEIFQALLNKINEDGAPQDGNIIKIIIDLGLNDQTPLQFGSQEYSNFIALHPEVITSNEDEDSFGLYYFLSIYIEYSKLKYENPNKSYKQLIVDAAWNVTLLELHTLLDMGGLVPGVGEICDISNGVIYSMEGNYLDASFSWSAAVPVVGWYSTGAKYATKIITFNGRLSRLVWKDVGGIVQFGNTLDAARQQLRRVMDTPTGMEAHHIIPWALRELPAVQKAAKSNGASPWHINYVTNGINLPLSRHSGSHPLYTTAVGNKVNQINNLPNLTNEMVEQRLSNLVSQIKNILENSTLHINDPQIAAAINNIVI